MTAANDDGPRWGVIVAYSDLLTASLLGGASMADALKRAQFLPDTYTDEEARLIQQLVASNIHLQKPA